uniref:Uncharacterized protein n=1 Tax=Rhizophora mucronata TaxID=61149 RepID=A0A2P2KUA5_RHIMU
MVLVVGQNLVLMQGSILGNSCLIQLVQLKKSQRAQLIQLEFWRRLTLVQRPRGPQQHVLWHSLMKVSMQSI